MIKPINLRYRRGIGQIEILIAAILLGTLTGLMSTLAYQINRIQKDAQLYQVAVYELTNQLRRLSQQNPIPLTSEALSLSVSPATLERLPSASLQARLIEDELGKRIEVEIKWDRVGSPPPLRMTSWVAPLNPTDTPEPIPNSVSFASPYSSSLPGESQ